MKTSLMYRTRFNGVCACVCVSLNRLFNWKFDIALAASKYSFASQLIHFTIQCLTSYNVRYNMLAMIFIRLFNFFAIVSFTLFQRIQHYKSQYKQFACVYLHPIKITKHNQAAKFTQTHWIKSIYSHVSALFRHLCATDIFWGSIFDVASWWTSLQFHASQTPMRRTECLLY